MFNLKHFPKHQHDELVIRDLEYNLICAAAVALFDMERINMLQYTRLTFGALAVRWDGL